MTDIFADKSENSFPFWVFRRLKVEILKFDISLELYFEIFENQLDRSSALRIVLAIVSYCGIESSYLKNVLDKNYQ